MRTWQGRARRGFSPHDVAESKFWFDAGNLVTNVSGAASAWVDRIGGFATSQGTAGDRPTIATGINGRPSLTCTATTKLVNTTDNPVTAGADKYLLFIAQASNAAGGTFLSLRLDAAQAQILCADFGICFWTSDGVANSVNDAVGMPAGFTSPFLVEFELVDGVVPTIRFNGAARIVGGGTSPLESGTTGFVLGSRGAANQGWRGELAQAYCASPVPSAADRAKLRTFYSTAHGITL